MKRAVKIEDIEIESIDGLLTELHTKKHRHEKELQEIETIIQLLESFQNTSGKKKNYIQLNRNKKKGIPAAVKKMLEEEGKLHIDSIHEKLLKNGIGTTKISLTALISGYASKGKIFQRVEPNTFSLIKELK